MSDMLRSLPNAGTGSPAGSGEQAYRYSETAGVLDEDYATANRLAVVGDLSQARTLYNRLAKESQTPKFRALIENDLATLAAVDGEFDLARQMYSSALQIDSDCTLARENLLQLQQDAVFPDRDVNCAQNAGLLYGRKTRVAIVSILFNWPSTGGGTIHTAETAKFLGRAGYEVRHFFSRFPEWGIGRMEQESLAPTEALEFDSQSWTAPEIQRRFRQAVDTFAPDFVIVTDSWNFKPLLAEAMRGYRYFIRLAAQECICPLNNVRLLVNDHGQASACPQNQLASPTACRKCVMEREHFSGSLHRAERGLSGYGTDEYNEKLQASFAEAEAVLVVNPLIAAMVSPYAKRVSVVPSGFDPVRFPWTESPANLPSTHNSSVRLIFAGLTQEFMKGFQVLRAACQKLWAVRQDFELVVTGDSFDGADEFITFIGWQTQDELPIAIRSADILIFPTIAEEALGRSAVEAMGAGRPVIASRIGGLQFTVTDGATGLLFEPGDANDLARKIEALLDDPDLRRRLGDAGRRQFEEHFTWDSVLRRHYIPMLGPPVLTGIHSETASTAVVHDAKSEPAPVDVCVNWSVDSVVLGCVLAIKNRPAIVLERTFQTFAFQSFLPADRVLLDYGSTSDQAVQYERLCRRFGWRLIRTDASISGWSLSAAYNLAVTALLPEVNVVFKGDVDVLLGEGVLETAAHIGRNRLCIFSCLATAEDTVYPTYLPNHHVLDEWRTNNLGLMPMDGEGIHAYPRRWFTEIGGFDLQYGTWGFEDSDLRLRATWSIGIEYPTEPLLIHQWHSRPLPKEAIQQNNRYYQATKPCRQLVRNGGQMLPSNQAMIEVVPSQNYGTSRVSGTAVGMSRLRICLATRALNPELSRLSNEFLSFKDLPESQFQFERYEIFGTDACGYFKELLRIDADWVVNLDEDGVLLDPRELCDLIQFMDRGGYAACGMPDGGVVPIRRHNRAACNGFFNIFDMRRVGAIWNNWEEATRAPYSPHFDALVPEFARRTLADADNFEPYYGLFFSLLKADEAILYLAGDEWRDGISTLLWAPTGAPLLLHAWYGREWGHDIATRARFNQLIADAQAYRRRIAELQVDHVHLPAVARKVIDEIRNRVEASAGNQPIG